MRPIGPALGKRAALIVGTVFACLFAVGVVAANRSASADSAPPDPDGARANLHKALDILEVTGWPEFRATVYARAGAIAARLGDHAEAQANFAKAFAVVSTMTSVRNDIFLSISQSQELAGDHADASKTLVLAAQRADAGAKFGGLAAIHDLSEIVDRQVALGDLENARRSARLAETALDEPVPGVSIALANRMEELLDLAAIYHTLGDTKGLQRITEAVYQMVPLARYTEDGVAQDYRSETVANIAYLQALAGNFDLAFDTIRNSIGQVGGTQADRDDAYRGIVRLQAKQGDISGAIRTIALISDSEERGQAYSDVGTVQARSGDVVGAAENLAQTSDHTIQGKDDLFVAYARAGDFEHAEAMLRQEAVDIQRQWETAELLVQRARHGDLENASRGVGALPTAVIRAYALLGIAQFQAGMADPWHELGQF